MTSMRRLAVQFTKPYQVKVVEEPVSAPATDQVLVRAIVSAISPGTELLVYRGQWPENLPIDATIQALAGKFGFPVKYGYAAVGQVISLGSNVSREWLDRLVFAFNPHESHFLALPKDLVPLPSHLSPDEAAFLPNMETAVSFLMDGRPLLGDAVAVFGQGVVGLLTTSLLARLPLSLLVTLDRLPLRREKATAFGAHAVLDPAEEDLTGRVQGLMEEHNCGSGVDLTYELSGNPVALDQAIALTGFNGRIVVGSWYGSKRANVDLGGYFHRSRIQIISSQVSALAPDLTGRWSKSRRLGLALRMLQEVKPASIITHRYHISQAEEAYELLDQHQEEAIQVMLTYEGVQ
jgi:2-desacetyl-2-hydroxyethyl bacteriochlorophyllide A dehydrogenase